MADWEDDWEKEITAPQHQKKQQRKVDAGNEKSAKPMSLEEYKALQNKKKGIVTENEPSEQQAFDYESYYKQKMGQMKNPVKTQNYESYNSWDEAGKGIKGKELEKGKGKSYKGKDSDKGKGKKGKDREGKGKKGKGKEGVDFDDGTKGKGKGKGKSEDIFGVNFVAPVEQRNFNENQGMQIAMKDTFLGAGNNDTHFTDKRWETQKDLCDLSFDALKEILQYEYMTKVQAWSYPFILAGKDVLARSKTGTGKTLAFLVPTIEKIFKARKIDVEKCYETMNDWELEGKPLDEDNYVAALVISPTRELAQAIGDECYRLTTYWYRMFRTTIIYGGVKLHWDYDIYDKARIDVLVATPGRLTDHLQNTKDFNNKVNNCPFSFTLVLDEADRLLEMGFRDEIEKIIQFLPTNKRKSKDGKEDESRVRDLRQSLLFSATVPEMVHNVGKMALRSDYRFVDCGNEMDDELEDKAIEEVTQKLLICEPVELIETFFNLILQAMREYPKNHKIMVFFITAKQTQFFAELANLYLPDLTTSLEKQGLSGKSISQKVFEIHSRMAYVDRDYVTKEFTDAKKGLLFSSDVTAKRSDIENVTHVIQVGVPANKDQYLARLGRTDRSAGSGSGKGVLILHPFEKYFLYQDLKELPQLERINMRLGWENAPVQKDRISKAVKKVMKSTRRATYSAWLGFYNSIHIRRLRMSKEELVDTANKYAADVLELEEQPAILKNTIKKMGLKDVKGLTVLEEVQAEEWAKEEDWLEEDMVYEDEDGGKRKKHKETKWDNDESWWQEDDNDWYGADKKYKKSKKSKKSKWWEEEAWYAEEDWNDWYGDAKKDKKKKKR